MTALWQRGRGVLRHRRGRRAPGRPGCGPPGSRGGSGTAARALSAATRVFSRSKSPGRKGSPRASMQPVLDRERRAPEIFGEGAGRAEPVGGPAPERRGERDVQRHADRRGEGGADHGGEPLAPRQARPGQRALVPAEDRRSSGSARRRPAAAAAPAGRSRAAFRRARRGPGSPRRKPQGRRASRSGSSRYSMPAGATRAAKSRAVGRSQARLASSRSATAGPTSARTVSTSSASSPRVAPADLDLERGVPASARRAARVEHRRRRPVEQAVDPHPRGRVGREQVREVHPGAIGEQRQHGALDAGPDRGVQAAGRRARLRRRRRGRGTPSGTGAPSSCAGQFEQLRGGLLGALGVQPRQRRRLADPGVPFAVLDDDEQSRSGARASGRRRAAAAPGAGPRRGCRPARSARPPASSRYGRFGKREKSGLRFSRYALRPSCPSSLM